MYCSDRELKERLYVNMKTNSGLYLRPEKYHFIYECKNIFIPILNQNGGYISDQRGVIYGKIRRRYTAVESVV